MLQPMADRHRNSFVKHLSLAATAACVTLMFAAGSVQQAAAQEMEEDSFETRIIKSLFGLEDRPAIEYRERSPLVVPPTVNLPPPKASALVSDPAWPKDADLQPKKKKKASAEPKSYEGWNSEGSPLTPYELERGTKRGAGLSPTDSTDAERGAPLRPDQLGYKGGLFGTLFGAGTEKDDSVAFTGEPPRTSLTAPPVGYQTPSPEQPYGLSAKKEAPKPFKLEDRGTTYD